VVAQPGLLEGFGDGGHERTSTTFLVAKPLLWEPPGIAGLPRLLVPKLLFGNVPGLGGLVGLVPKTLIARRTPVAGGGGANHEFGNGEKAIKLIEIC
jgi:hypothetical protein